MVGIVRRGRSRWLAALAVVGAVAPAPGELVARPDPEEKPAAVEGGANAAACALILAFMCPPWRPWCSALPSSCGRVRLPFF